MTHYTDIKILNSPEMSRFAIMNTLFEKFHKSLVDEGLDSVGVSFPAVSEEYRDLGVILRVHGSEADVRKVIANRHIKSVSDYVDIKDVAVAPESALFRCVKRVQSKSNPDRLRRRAMKRHGITMEEAIERIPDNSAKLLNLPFVTINSSSNGHKFRLFIEHGEEVETSVDGEFSCYGLSAKATVPWF